MGGPEDETERGFAALREGRAEDAIRHFRVATQADPRGLRAWKGMSQACRDLERWRDALVAYNGLIASATRPEDVVEAYMSKAHILDQRLGRDREAREHYERVLQFDASQVTAYLALAELDLRAGKWATSVAYADHGLEVAPPDGVLRAWLLVVRAVAMRRTNLSMGPVSSFFRGLRGEAAVDPSEAALDQAFALVPELRGRLPEGELVGDRAVPLVGRHLPRHQPRSWLH